MTQPDNYSEEPENEGNFSHQGPDGDLIQQAYAYELDSQYQAAVAIYLVILADHSKDAWLNAHLANCLSMMDQWEEALKYFHAALEIAPDYSWALFGRSRAFSALGMTENALADVNQALTLDHVDMPWLFSERGDLLCELGRFEEATEAYEEALCMKPDQPKVLANYGVAMVKSGRHEEGLFDLRRALELDPRDTWTHYYIGNTLREMNRNQEALGFYETSINCDPDQYAPRFARAMLYRDLGSFDKAREELSYMLARWPENPHLYSARGEINFTQSRWAEAIKDYDRAIALGDLGEAWANRGEARRQLGQVEEALTDLTRAIELLPDFGWPLAVRGEVYRTMRRYEDAVKDYSAALELQPDYAWALSHRGAAYEDMGMYETARTDFMAALEIEPNGLWSLYHLGVIEAQLDHYPESEHWFLEVLKIDPGYHWALNGLVDIYIEQKRYSEIIQFLETFRGEHPESVIAMRSLALAYERTGDHEEALRRYNDMVAADPRDFWALEHRGALKKYQFRLLDALEDFSRGVVLAPENPVFWVYRAQVYRNLRRFDLALADYANALAAGENSGWALGNRGLLLRQMGELKLSEADIRKGITQGYRNAWSWSQLGFTLLQMERLGEAQKCFEEALKLDDKDAGVHEGLAMTYLARHNRDAFQAELVQTILYTQEGLSKHDENWRDQLSLALYLLLKGEREQGLNHYRETFARMNHRYLLEEALVEGVGFWERFQPDLPGLAEARAAIEAELARTA